MMKVLESQIGSTVDYDPAQMEDAFAAFKQAYPAFEATRFMDEVRSREYARLDEGNHIYLDYTGGGLYAQCQLREHMDLLSRNVYGNPHSNNPTSLAMTRLAERARAYVLEFFNGSPDEYVVVFTANATGALKLVGESYPFAPGGRYLLTFDNHNSVNGIREFARAKGASITYLPIVQPELRVDVNKLTEYLDLAQNGAHNLLAFPAQSNFSGVQHPLEMIEQARSKGWDVLVDCAAFVPTNRLDLGRWQPDFVSLSFYKMFGYPTGVGCLLARRSALGKLKRPWYAGGTIKVSSVQGDDYYLAEGEAAFEDGTINYLSLPAVEIGLRYIASIGIETIHERVICLTGWLIEALSALCHSSGKPLVRIHGPKNTYMRGGTVTVTFYDLHGKPIDDRRIEELANKANISLRTGCFCNPGAGEVAHGLTREMMEEFFREEEGETFLELRAAMQKKHCKSISAVRVSVGLATSFADVYKFVLFAQSFLDKTSEEIGGIETEFGNCDVARDSA
jgi:selenocysteine lyase/cysteine desulfurase